MYWTKVVLKQINKFAKWRLHFIHILYTQISGNFLKHHLLPFAPSYFNLSCMFQLWFFSPLLSQSKPFLTLKLTVRNKIHPLNIKKIMKIELTQFDGIVPKNEQQFWCFILFEEQFYFNIKLNFFNHKIRSVFSSET